MATAAGLVDRAGPQTDDRYGEQARHHQGAAQVARAEDFGERARLAHGSLLLLEKARLVNLEQGVERHEHRRQAAQEHGAPAVVRTDREVERCRDEEAEVIAGLQVTGPHLAPVFRPGLRHVGAGHRPLAADPDAGQEAKQAELPYAVGEIGGAGEDGIGQHGRGERLRPAEPVGDRSPDEREPPTDEKDAEQDGPIGADVLRARRQSGLRQEFGERGASTRA